ncbi:MAG: DUF503 domain-containing protein [Candidatus Dadabacteria bacterium]|nr:DUF503 domain-containing protein [Candidatus Dadabacteria bacterium]
MVVGVEKIEIIMDGNRSLKDKRQILRSLIQRVKSKFNNVSISEVDSHDLWQRATLGVSFVSNDSPLVNSLLDQIIGFIDTLGTVEIVGREIEIIHF